MKNLVLNVKRKSSWRYKETGGSTIQNFYSRSFFLLFKSGFFHRFHWKFCSYRFFFNDDRKRLNLKVQVNQQFVLSLSEICLSIKEEMQMEK